MAAAEREHHRPGDPGAWLPRGLLLIGGLVSLLVLAVGVIIAIAGPLKIGLFVIVCVPLGWVLALTQIALIRRRASGKDSGVALAPPVGAQIRATPPVPPHDPSGNVAPRRWAGGINVPAATGRVSATFRVGELELTGGTLVFRIKSPTFQRLFKTQVLTVAPGDRVTIFPVKRLLGMGVAIQPERQEVWYFWTNSGPEILAAISAAGFEISPERPGPRR